MAAAAVRAPTAYLSIPEMAEMYHKSKNTVRSYLQEIDADPRYKDAWVDLEPGARVRHINRNVFEDYLHHRTFLRDRGLRKHVQPYDPVMVARQRGEQAI